MAAIALLPKLWLPQFEPWRLLRPLKMEGQFFPRQGIQFSDGVMPANIGVGGGITDPTDLPDLVFWLDTDAGVTLDGTEITNWEAVNDATLDFVPLDAVNDPIEYTGITINGHKALEKGAGASDTEIQESSVTHNIGTGDFYAAVVMHLAGTGGDARLISGAGSAFRVGFAGGGTPDFEIELGGSTYIFTSFRTISTPADYVVEAWRDGTSIRMRVNGTIDTDSLTSSDDAGTSGATSLELNDHKIGDAVLTSSLPSASQRDGCRDYLNDEFGGIF